MGREEEVVETLSMFIFEWKERMWRQYKIFLQRRPCQMSCKRTWRSSMEPLQSSPLVQHRPSPLSEAPQLSSPVYLTFPFNMCFWSPTWWKVRPSSLSFLMYTMARSSRSLDHMLSVRQSRKWSSDTGSLEKGCLRAPVLQIQIQSPKIVRVNGSCRAEIFLHKRGSWVGDFKIACFFLCNNDHVGCL